MTLCVLLTFENGANKHADAIAILQPQSVGPPVAWKLIRCDRLGKRACRFFVIEVQQNNMNKIGVHPELMCHFIVVRVRFFAPLFLILTLARHGTRIYVYV